MTKSSVRLITIPVSHYCEKARWALERADIAYEEIRHLQIFHYGSTLWHGRSLYAPVLVTDQGSIKGSSDIARWADAHAASDKQLFPTDPELLREVSDWDSLFDETIGVDGRRWLYRMLFEHLSPDQLVAMAAQGVPGWERALMKPLLPVAKAYMSRRLNVDEGSAEASLVRVRDIFERVGKQVAGREFLVGDRFTAADLSFASLSALVLMPSQYGARLLDVATLPDPMRSVIEELRATEAGRYALRLFERHRS